MATSSASSRAALTGNSRRNSSSVSAPTLPSGMSSGSIAITMTISLGFDFRFQNDGSRHSRRLWPRRFRADAGNLLVYGLVGWSWLDVDTNFRIRHEDFDDEPIFKNDDSFSANGLTFGGGVEWRFTENLSIRGEYRFTDFDNFGNNGRFDCDLDVCDGGARFRVPQRHRSQCPARAVHHQLALWRVRCDHCGGLLIRTSVNEIWQAGPDGPACFFMSIGRRQDLQPFGDRRCDLPVRDCKIEPCRGFRVDIRGSPSSTIPRSTMLQEVDMSQLPGQTLNTVIEFLFCIRHGRSARARSCGKSWRCFRSRTAPCWWKTCASGCCFVGAARPKTPDQRFSSHHGRPRAGHLVFGNSQRVGSGPGYQNG